MSVRPLELLIVGTLSETHEIKPTKGLELNSPHVAYALFKAI